MPVKPDHNPETPESAELILKHFSLIRYLVIALLVFIALLAIQIFYVTELDNYGKYLEILTALSAKMLNWIGEDAVPFWNASNFMTDLHLKADGAYITVTSDSDAGVFYAMILAMILPWPGKILTRILAAVTGVALMFVLNLVRIAAMLLVDIHIPVHFDLMANWILPLALAGAVMAYFIFWMRISGTHPSQ